MTNTSNYNLLLAEGTDLVNYLTQTNPNFTNLDTIIKAVSDATVTTATEVTSGTAHAISRSLPDANVIRFTATSNWVTGDTMTVDGVTVTPLKTDGTSLKTGDYLIGSAVLMILDGIRCTVFVSSSPDAADVRYDNTSSGLTATDVQDAIDENANDISTLNNNLTDKVTITATVGDTIASMLNRLVLTIDITKLSVHSVIEFQSNCYFPLYLSPTVFQITYTQSNRVYIKKLEFSGNHAYNIEIATNGAITTTDISGDSVTVGTTMTLHYGV